MCFAAAVCLGLLFPLSSFALSDAEFNKLLKASPEFKAENQNLNQMYKKLMSSVEGDDKIWHRDDQRHWLKAELDKEAREYMAQGLSKAQAYAKAFHARANVLRVAWENSGLSEEDMGRAKADDDYNAQGE